MGNRVKGRVKRKSVKAAMAKSAVGSARKLSRMGKKAKKHHAGVDATFIGRSKCLKLLQITLKDFRRLCILKGVYPREPVNATPKSKRGQTLYHAKDIKAVAHEPVLQKFRDVRAFMKKVRRAAGRNERDEAARKHAAVPAYTLHHLVKERYPRFLDAVADLDDGLTVLYLFAALPGRGSDNDDIRPAVIQRAKTIAAAWGAYCATVSAVTKCFVSVKGVYVEAAVLPAAAPAVRWIIPHAFTQHMPDEVDYRVMMTFFEFYETLLNFVLFKLYHGIGIRYPVNLAAAAAADGAVAAAGGTTATLLHAHLRALSAGFESQSGAGAVSSVVAESVQAVSSSTKMDHGEDGNMVEADGGSGDSKKKQKKAKQKKKDSRELIKSVSAALNQLKEEEEENDNDSDEDHDENSSDAVDVAGPLEAALKESVGNIENGAEDDDGVGGGGPDAAKPLQAVLQNRPDAAKRRCLFQGLTFFLSREVPRGYLELVSLSHGAVVGWEEGTGSAGSGAAGTTADCSPVSASDKSITHYICDRPKPPVNKKHWPANREYVQPQWILDSANFQFLLPVSRYRTGCADLLPPHLSPWVDNEEEGYTPAYAAEIAKLKSGGGVVSTAVEDDDDDDDDDEDEEHAADQKDDQGHDKNSDVDKREEKAKRAAEDKNDDSDSDDDDDESEDSNDDDNSKDEMTEDAEKHQNDKKKRRRNYNDSDDDDDEAKRLARSMMSRKAAHLYGRMQHGIAAKKAKVDALHQRRKEIDQSKKKDSESGKSVQKQKVERLKKHRKDIEDTYSHGEGNSMKKKKKKRTHKKHHDKKKNKTNA